jgi:hypothetical protein
MRKRAKRLVGGRLPRGIVVALAALILAVPMLGLTCNSGEEKAASEAAEQWLRNSDTGFEDLAVTSSSDTRATVEAETDEGELILEVTQEGGEWVVDACQPDASGQVGSACPFGTSDSGSQVP